MEACIQLLREIISKGVMYITLQEFYWMVMIVWVLYQMLKDLYSNKKK